MYPNTAFELVDQTGKVASSTTVEPIITQAIVSSTEKGPEEMMYVTKENFYKLFGSDISFAKHGQPLIQACNAIENGATLLFKRLVADDSKLANIVILANVSQKEVQKQNSDGDLLYIDPVTGNETTDKGEGNEPAVENKCIIKYQCESVVGSTSISDQYDTIIAKYKNSENVYPLFLISDNGRGVSKKRIKISPDYDSSKYKEYMKYELSVIESSEIIEKIKFTLDHTCIENKENKSIENMCKKSTQIKAKLFETYFDSFIAKVVELTGYDEDYVLQNDLLFGMTKVGKTKMDYIDVDLNEGFNLSFVYGIDLTSGDNGSFGTAPFGTDDWARAAGDFFDGSFDNKIYDLYNTPIDVIIDANYPKSVKYKIEELAMFREDFLYMRDSGLGLYSKEDVIAYNSDFSNSKFIMPYHLSYDIIDSFTRKQITVTVGYSLSRLMVNHFTNGRNRPIAGFLHSMTIPEAVENTINFLPSITPDVNEKEELDDARVNYASYYDNTLVLETFYTSQSERTDFSYGNNTLAIQELMKAIRKRCPKIRYSFIDGDDLTTYQEDVNAVIAKYAGNFNSVEMVYAEDEAAIDENIYYAIIYVSFRPFVQAEKFKLIALPVSSTTDTE